MSRRPTVRRTPTRVGRIALLSLLVLVVTAGPAAADPPGPTNYDSEVVAITPQVDGLEVQVLGGDAFLQVRNPGGHEVGVPGYAEGEQYLRFDPDGSVWVNLRSATHWQNSARYSIQDSEVPADAGPGQPPRWEQVSDDGTYAWHDHRIHWMSPSSLPGEVDPTSTDRQVAYEWPVPLVVDGETVEVVGTLTWVPPASPLPTVLAALAGLALAAVLLVTTTTTTTIAVLVGIGVVVTGAVGIAGSVGLPPGVQGQPFPLILTGVALLVAVAGLAVRGRTAAGGVVAGAAGIPLVVWGISQVAAVTAPIVPPAVLPSSFVRIAIGLAVGTGLGAIAAGLKDLFSRPLVPGGGEQAVADAGPVRPDGPGDAAMRGTT
ncbi:hypothetical protein [Salsipaludibacter albus]|uniref:hypothetical protein n=1 Tax=Salsipaludibacter albus TaxID=2849650 RepID=UPI001EE44F9C|nr:hypothetical protein [Salsipaludibacter albus]MBY5163993.1 hypothetical protein [Salsipaludibacter albus]